ncbi:hypothetical protein REPUB_Repub03eG0159000 [Reevesia pubescens]
MANTAALAKKRKLDASRRHHDHKVSKYSGGRDFQAGCENQTRVLVPMNSYSANGKSLPDFKVSAPCRTQHSRLFNTASPIGIGKFNPLDVAKDATGSVKHKLESVSSDKVDETIKLFQKVLSDLRRKKKGNTEIDGQKIGTWGCKLHSEAANILRKQGKWVNAEKRLGTVPGVGVHNEFQYRAELTVIGLHCQLQKGIDFMEIDGEKLATSIVDSRRYFDKTETVKSSDFLIYYGAGGNPSVQKTEPKDQRLVGGNWALYNSMMKKSPVRVIRKIYEFPGRSSKSSKFVYEGLYLVDSCKKVRSEKHDKLVYKFVLTKQCGDHQSQKTSGCDCTDGCSESGDCSCKIKNGGIIPYNNKGCLANPRPLIIECGPSCKCSESCSNRVSQRLSKLQQERGGPIFELEKFRSGLGVLGVRARCFIPKGSFVCEYEEGIGKLLNISTSPNIFAQKVLYDDEDESRPHVMLFAMEDIPYMKRLTIRENLRRTIITSI